MCPPDRRGRNARGQGRWKEYQSRLHRHPGKTGSEERHDGGHCRGGTRRHPRQRTSRDKEGLGSAITGVLGGAAAGGAHEAYYGYEDSRQERTAFAALLAEKVKEVEDELQYIIQGQEESKEALRERSRESNTREQDKEDEVRSSLEYAYGDLLALQEELELLAEEGRNIGKARSRAERADKLYQEAEEACDAVDYTKSRAKLKAAVSMIESSRNMLNEE